MKILSIKKIATLSLAIGLLASCKKYEDGPYVSLIPKKERVANTWIIENAYENGNEVTDNYDQYELFLSKDGDTKLVAIYTFGDFTAEFETDGTWMFENNQETITVDYENNDADNSYQILRLQEKSLWVREKGGEIELHLKPAS